MKTVGIPTGVETFFRIKTLAVLTPSGSHVKVSDKIVTGLFAHAQFGQIGSPEVMLG